MKRTRAGLGALFGALLLATIVDPVAAQSTADTTTEELIWGLNAWLLYLAVPITVLVEGILIYTVWKYRKNEDPLPTKENRRLEIVWTIATAIVLVAVGVGSYLVLASPWVTGAAQADIATEEDPIEIDVVAQRYSWTFAYPNETVAATSNATGSFNSTNELVIPNDRPIRLNVTSTDWLHSFHVPDLGLKQDAFPGQYQSILTKPQETGSYQLYCAEYCGSGHSEMLGTVRIVSQDEFSTWVSEQGS